MSSKARRLLKQIKNSKTLNNKSTPSNTFVSTIQPSSSDMDPLVFLSQYTCEIEPLNIEELINDDDDSIIPPQHSATTKACGMKSKFFTKQLLLNQSSCDEEDNSDVPINQCPLSTSDLPLHNGIMFKSCKRMQTHRDNVAKMKEKYMNLHSFSERVKRKFMHNTNKYEKVERVVNELIGLPTKVINDDVVQDIGEKENEILPRRRKLNLVEIEMLMS